MRLKVLQRFAFHRPTEVIAPGHYQIDRLTLNAIRRSRADLLREGLIRLEDGADADELPHVDLLSEADEMAEQ